MPLTRRGTLRLFGLAGIGGISACVRQAIISQSSAPAQSPVSQIAQTTGDSTGESVDRLAQLGIFAPPRGDARLVVISDLNSQYGSTDYEPEVDRVIALIPDWQPDLVLCGGDMVAGQKTSLTRSQIQAMWNAFDQHVSAPLRRANIPFGFTIGNHDASGARSSSGFIFAQERNLASAYWNDPRHNPGLQFVDRAGYPFYYSFLQNEIFFLVWDASTSQIPADQLAWAERSLASSAAQSAKLRIAIGHLPLYAVAIGRDRPGEYLDQGDRLRALLERYRVHTYISGHNHAYFPGYVGNLQTLHAGLLGSGVRQLLNGNSPLLKTATVIDVNLTTADTTYTTYDAKTMQVVNQRILPRFIDSPTAKILRRDVQWADLTTAEQESRYVPKS
ncbi:metallophosphoesterase family protein [Leptolyngbya ohadii]|uniref:metallophosphoesterase family protein n=1 Tax=Leptolyngbya ohadii TaxID=1962290 RepID=UPI000B59D1E7|nr:metallophosphoesterase [Leptolyngbya ohadii]